MNSRKQNLSSALLKQEFLNKWIKGLQTCNNLNHNEMNIFERKNAIKSLADIAIASTRNNTTQWSRALINNVISKDEKQRILVEHLLGRKLEKSGTRAVITCSRKILRRSHTIRQRAKRAVPQSVIKASSIVKKLVKNRTRVLKSLVPGGNEMDNFLLIKETLDYILSLRVQVDVMQCIANAAGRDNQKPNPYPNLNPQEGYCN